MASAASNSRNTHSTLVEDIHNTLDSFTRPFNLPSSKQHFVIPDHNSSKPCKPLPLKLEEINIIPEESLRIGSEWVHSPSFSKSYAEEWERLFCLTGDTLRNHLKNVALEGGLRNSRFRSVCWRMYLNVLSCDPAQWEQETELHRQNYMSIKEKFNVDSEDVSVDSPTAKIGSVCEEDDPLSLDENSRWNRHFKLTEMRREILQDVVRTFPELQFFHDSNVRSSMVRVLLCYSLTSTLRYKQGMHEILAPLVFVLHCDHMAFEHANELLACLPEPVSRCARVLLDPNFLEHDAFAMFSSLMGLIGAWYCTEPSGTDSPVKVALIPSRKRSSLMESNNGESSPQNRSVTVASGSGAVLEALRHIHEDLLKNHSRELYSHLQSLEIAPQMYGLRWLRLLFGREFPLQDLLVVWDAVFGLQNGVQLVHCIFVAMLANVRHLLLRSDFSECLCLLMRYPQVVDVHALVSVALNLLDSTTYPHSPAKFGNLHQHQVALAMRNKSRRRSERNKTVSVIGMDSFASILPRWGALSPFSGPTAVSRPESPLSMDSSSSIQKFSTMPRNIPHRSLSLRDPAAPPVDLLTRLQNSLSFDTSTSREKFPSAIAEREQPIMTNTSHYQFRDFVEIRLPHEESQRASTYYRELCLTCARVLDACVMELHSLLPDDASHAVHLTSGKVLTMRHAVESVREVGLTLRSNVILDRSDHLSRHSSTLPKVGTVLTRSATDQNIASTAGALEDTEDASDQNFVTTRGGIFESKVIELSELSSSAPGPGNIEAGKSN